MEFCLGELGETSFVDGDTINDVLAEDAGGPDAEVGGFAGVDAVADGDDGVEVVDFELTADGAISFLGNL